MAREASESTVRQQEDQLAELQEELRRVSEASPYSDSLQTVMTAAAAAAAARAQTHSRAHRCRCMRAHAVVRAHAKTHACTYAKTRRNAS